MRRIWQTICPHVGRDFKSLVLMAQGYKHEVAKSEETACHYVDQLGITKGVHLTEMQR